MVRCDDPVDWVGTLKLSPTGWCGSSEWVNAETGYPLPSPNSKKEEGGVVSLDKNRRVELAEKDKERNLEKT